MVQVLTSPVALPQMSPSSAHLSIVSYNVLLPNSVDGWWNYKMYSPTLNLSEDKLHTISTWEYRKDLLKNRLALLDADIVCLQEVSPKSFEDDFKFMQDIGYNGCEMFKKGRFRPATFWKTSKLELTSPPVHKDRTLLTSFRRKDAKINTNDTAGSDGELKANNWYVLNCHLQAGQQAQRRVRQINEGVGAVMTLARKQKEKDPERCTRVIVCGDFNGGEENGAIRYLEDGYVDENFFEEGGPVTSSRKDMPFGNPLTDVASTPDRDPPPTLVVSELISQMVEDKAYENPRLSDNIHERLASIYEQLATHETGDSKIMNVNDVEKWLKLINVEVGRGSEFRSAAIEMGWKDCNPEASFEERKQYVKLPRGGFLSLDGFIKVYEEELRGGKFWGIAHDLSVLGEPLPDAGLFKARFDRIYYSEAIRPIAVVDTICDRPCPNEAEPSDHLPVAAVFTDLRS